MGGNNPSGRRDARRFLATTAPFRYTEARTTDGPGDRYASDALLAFARKLTPTTAAAAVAALTGLLATFERATDDIAILALGMTVGLSDPAAVSR